MSASADMFGDLQSVLTGAYLDIQPSGTLEAVVHNIYHEAEITLHWYDGTNDLQCSDLITGAGVESNLQIHVRNTLRLRIKNENAGTKKIGYDGLVIHP